MSLGDARGHDVSTVCHGGCLFVATWGFAQPSLLSTQTSPWCSKSSDGSHRLYHVSQLDSESQQLLAASLPWPLIDSPKRYE